MKKIISLLIAVILASSMTLSVFAEDIEANIYWLLDVNYIDDSYDVQDNCTEDGISQDDATIWWTFDDDSGKGIALRYHPDILDFLNRTVKVPDSFRGNNWNSKKRYTTRISWSCPINAFDLNPENNYMKLIDNVVFSKDGKKLMSYAQGDERTFYEIPDGTETICLGALWECNNIKEISMPDSVKEIQKEAFGAMEALEKIYISPDSDLRCIGCGAFWSPALSEIVLPSFELEIGSNAFGSNNMKLKSYVKPEVKAFYSSKTNTYKLKWDKIPNASCYEVYQKLSDGSYKLIKETSKTSISFKNIKSGKRYTFAVKPIAEIKAIEDDEYSEIEYYTIEGTMSEDCTFRGK